MRARQRRPNKDSPDTLLHERFFAALVLNQVDESRDETNQQVVQEKTQTEIEINFGVSRGQLQSFITSSSTFAGMVSNFCTQLMWREISLLISNFIPRISSGAGTPDA